MTRPLLILAAVLILSPLGKSINRKYQCSRIDLSMKIRDCINKMYTYTGKITFRVKRSSFVVVQNNPIKYYLVETETETKRAVLQAPGCFSAEDCRSKFGQVFGVEDNAGL